MKKSFLVLVTALILAGLFTSCDPMTHTPKSDKLPEGKYVCRNILSTTGSNGYTNNLDGQDTTSKIDLEDEYFILTVLPDHKVTFSWTKYTYIVRDSETGAYTTLEEPVAEVFTDCSGTYQMYDHDQVMFMVEGDEHDKLQSGCYWDYWWEDDVLHMKKYIYIPLGGTIMFDFVYEQ